MCWVAEPRVQSGDCGKNGGKHSENGGKHSGTCKCGGNDSGATHQVGKERAGVWRTYQPPSWMPLSFPGTRGSLLSGPIAASVCKVTFSFSLQLEAGSDEERKLNLR